MKRSLYITELPSGFGDRELLGVPVPRRRLVGEGVQELLMLLVDLAGDLPYNLAA